MLWYKIKLKIKQNKIKQNKIKYFLIFIQLLYKYKYIYIYTSKLEFSMDNVVVFEFVESQLKIGGYKPGPVNVMFLNIHSFMVIDCAPSLAV
jgi:hypothetical protein